jgi:hypothetical protein
MSIHKTQISLLAVPLVAAGVIGVAALSLGHASAAPAPQPTPTLATSSQPEAADATEPKSTTPDTDNVQSGPQDGAQDSQGPETPDTAAKAQ